MRIRDTDERTRSGIDPLVALVLRCGKEEAAHLGREVVRRTIVQFDLGDDIRRAAGGHAGPAIGTRNEAHAKHAHVARPGDRRGRPRRRPACTDRESKREHNKCAIPHQFYGFGSAKGTSRCKAEGRKTVDQERPKRNSTKSPCRSCGSDDRTRVARDVKAAGATFQVVVACATCGHAFAALSRN